MIHLFGFVQGEGVHAKIQGVLLEEIKITSLIRVGCVRLLLPWVPCRRGLRACGSAGPAVTPQSPWAPRVQEDEVLGFRRSAKQS